MSYRNEKAKNKNWDKVKNINIGEGCGITIVVKWARNRQSHWRGHVEEMDNKRLAKIIVMTGNPTQTR